MTTWDDVNYAPTKPRPPWPNAKTLGECLPGQHVVLRETAELVLVSRVTKRGAWVRYADGDHGRCCPHPMERGVQCVNATLPDTDEERAA